MFFTKITVDIRSYFFTVPNGSVLQGTIILLTSSTSNFGEEVFMPPIDGEKLVWVTSCFFSRRRFSWMDVNIPWVIHGFFLPYYMFLV